PLAMPFVGGVGVKAECPDIVFKLVAAEAGGGIAGIEGAVWIEEETAVAVEDFGSQGEPFELIILERHPVEFEVDASHAAFLFGHGAAVGLDEGAAAVLFGRID